MTFLTFVRLVLLFFALPTALALQIYLHFYPLLLSCAFPVPSAPVRILAIGDPQIEGNTALWRYRTLPSDPLSQRILKALYRGRKVIDLWGNDKYLAHIYSTIQRFVEPTHITVLGDLLGSQWIDDEEFHRRADRFWTIFGGGPLEKRPLLIPGNHDVGYSGDMTHHRILRYEQRFGDANYEFKPNETTDLRIVGLNSMVLDGPRWDDQLYYDVDAFLRGLEGKYNGTTILLTHLPMEKPPGVCVDGPETLYFPGENGQLGGLRSQNFMSQESGERVRDRLMAGRGLILTGHDHAGCYTNHFQNEEGVWQVEKPAHGDHQNHGILEVTVRSIMGDYSGNVGLMSAWQDGETQAWRFDYRDCAMGTQHWWWLGFGFNAGVIACLSVLVTGTIMEAGSKPKPPVASEGKKKQ